MPNMAMELSFTVGGSAATVHPHYPIGLVDVVCIFRIFTGVLEWLGNDCAGLQYRVSMYEVQVPVFVNTPSHCRRLFPPEELCAGSVLAWESSTPPAEEIKTILVFIFKLGMKYTTHLEVFD